MTSIALKANTFRFDQMAVQVKDKVEPEDANVDRYVGLEHIDPGSLKIRRWGEPGDVESSKILFKSGDIIFGKRRAYQRKLAVADFDGICSAHAMVLRPKTDVVLEKFLPFFMQSDVFMERAVAISVGGLSPTINWKAMAKEEFALPEVEEQGRMVKALEAIRTATETAFRLAETLDIAEIALLRHTFGERHGRSAPGLETVKLEEIADVRAGLAKGKAADSETTTLPYLSVSNVKDGYLDLETVKEIVVRRNRVDRFVLKTGDVLMTEGGDIDKLGRGTVWQNEIPGCLHQNHVFAVRVDTNRIEPWYLAALARSPYGRSYFLKCAKRSSNLASINKAQVSAFRVPLMPIDDQREWLESYRSIRQEQASARSRSARSASLIACVMGQGNSK